MPYIVQEELVQLVRNLRRWGNLPQGEADDAYTMSNSRIDLIDALELQGAIILDHHEINPEKIVRAFKHWRRALRLRLLDTEDYSPMHKTPLKSKNGQLSEWSTLDDLQRIEQQPAQLKLQSFLVQLRILSRYGWAAVNHDNLIDRFLALLQMGHVAGSMSELTDVIWATVETLLRLERPHEEKVHDLVYQIPEALFFIFKHLPEDNPSFNSENLMKILELVLLMDKYNSNLAVHHEMDHMGTPAESLGGVRGKNVEKAPHTYWISDPSALVDLAPWTKPPPPSRPPLIAALHMGYLYEMIMLLSRFPAESITEEASNSLLQLVNRDEEGCNLLHYACSDDSSESLSAIRFLNKLGANLNARNNKGNGPLHILSSQPVGEIRDPQLRPEFLALFDSMVHGVGPLQPVSETRDAKGRLLIELGAHLDMVNKEGMTAADLWFQTNTPGKRDVADLPDWLQEGVPN